MIIKTYIYPIIRFVTFVFSIIKTCSNIPLQDLLSYG
jgi:hypothetical protein